MFLILGCGLITRQNYAEDDSLAYYPPTPAQMGKEQFRDFHRRTRAHFDSSLFSKGFNGSLLIAKNGVIILEKYSGLADLRKPDSLTASTPLHLASVSKPIVAMSVLHLTERGGISLDDTLGKFFPAFPYQGITIRMLLSQRSGIPNYLNFLSKLKKKDTCYHNDDVLNSLYRLRPPLEFRPSTRFNYSNTNYVLLALLMERATGESYPVYMKRIFFDPLRMTNTFICSKADSGCTPTFDWNGRYWPPDPFDCTFGDKNIYSTPQDLLKWDQALTNGLIVKKATLDAAFTPLSHEKPSVHNYGLGWRMLELPHGKKVIYHNGRWHGTNSVFVRLMDENATIIILGNKFNRHIYLSARKAYDIFGEYWQQNTGPEEIENSEGGSVSGTKISNPASTKKVR